MAGERVGTRGVGLCVRVYELSAIFVCTRMCLCEGEIECVREWGCVYVGVCCALVYVHCVCVLCCARVMCMFEGREREQVGVYAGGVGGLG